MNVERRSLLKGMALGSLAGVAMGSSSLSLANAIVGGQPRIAPTLVLVNAAVAGSPFLQGIGASPAARQVEVQTTDLSLDFLQGVQKRLRNGQAQRIIGLVDDASAALIVDLARSSGARIQWLGQHSANAGASHHHLLSADAAHGCALQLGIQLNTCGTGFELIEQRPHGHQPPLQLSAATRSKAGAEQWAAALGYTLAMLGTAHTGQAPLVASRQSPLTGTFVSFSIEA
ncbi:hypothetical protein D9M68_157390 [compost metagenome]